MKNFKFFGKNKGNINTSQFNTDELEFWGVSPLLYNPYTFSACKHMLYRHISSGEIIKRERIYEGHPLWNYSD